MINSQSEKVAQKSMDSRLIVGGDIAEIIKGIMTVEKVSQGDITKKLNMKSQSGVSQALNRDMRMSMVLRFLEVLGCEIVVKHNKSEYRVSPNPVKVENVIVGKLSTAEPQADPIVAVPIDEPAPKLDLDELLKVEEPALKPKSDRAPLI